MVRRSAGLLPYRRRDGVVEVFLGHMGGPLWARKEAGAWTLLKGELDDGEDAAAAADREFAEETGLEPPAGQRVALGTVRQKGGKEVTAWAVEADLDADAAVSGTFELPWPPRSGRVQTFPEIDRFRWWPLPEARDVVVGAQAELLDRLAAVVGAVRPDDPPVVVRLPDGTLKQRSPLTGTEVWTVPRRAHRPGGGRRGGPGGVREPLDPAVAGRVCAFCPGRHLETPPEKARMLSTGEVLRHVPASALGATEPELRRFANLFEILSVDYWRTDHGWTVPEEVRARAAAYVERPLGREHVLGVLRRRAAAEGVDDGAWAALPEAVRLERAVDLFAGAHDVVVARRHHVEGARFADELAGPGTLTPDEHHRFVAFTLDTVRALYDEQPHARYVVAFQNWLRPAGASFDHLHKQVIAIDEPGPRTATVLGRLREDPGLIRRRVLAHAEDRGLVVARTEHAVALAGVGHTYPAFEVWSLDDRLPWEHDDAQVRGMSDLLHALHAATGVDMPSNEEWHHRPPDATERLPWNVVLKWRDATAAGFEGATGIHVTTVDPWVLRADTVARLRELRGSGVVGDVRLGDE